METTSASLPGKNLSERFHQASFFTLRALLFTLPLFEAPKNILLGVLAVVMMAQAFTGQWRRPGWSTLDITLLAVVGVTALSTWTNAPFDNAGKGLKDAFCQALVCMVVLRAGFSGEEQNRLAISATLGTVVAILWGVWDAVSGVRPALELHSVGVVTHSAIYTGMITLLAWGKFIDTTQSRRTRVMWFLALVILLMGLAGMASRGAVLAVGAALALSAITRAARRLLPLALGVAALSGVLIFSLPNVFDQDRILNKVEIGIAGTPTNESDSQRLTLWRVSWAQITQGGHGLLGVGPRNFSSIDLDKLHFDRPLAYDARGHLTHAHNLFLNKLVEEGVLGLFGLITYFGLVAGMLGQAARQGDTDWLWVAALGALAVPVIAGLFNTPWMGEHALLGAVIFGLLAAKKRTR
ncbi:MAG: hypothetical protein RIR70_441 [Pseudomonadota bacterium]|jgi:hypothetical protein